MKEYWRSAAKELKNVRSITGASLLMALGPVLSMMTIQVNQHMQIGFTSLVHAMTGYLYGPALAAVAGGAADILKYIIKPTGRFFPGFTLNEILVGFVYGCFFYKKEITWKKTIVARMIMTFGINLTLTPLWLSIMYGNAFKVMVPLRIMKNIAMIPIDVFLLYTVLKFTQKNLKRK